MAKFIWNNAQSSEGVEPFRLSIKYELDGSPRYIFSPRESVGNSPYSIQYGWEFQRNKPAEVVAGGTGMTQSETVSADLIEFLASGRKSRATTESNTKEEKLKPLDNIICEKRVEKNSSREIVFTRSDIGERRDFLGSNYMFKCRVDGLLLQEVAPRTKLNPYVGNFQVTEVAGTLKRGLGTLFSIRNVVDYSVKFFIYKRDIKTTKGSWSLLEEINIPRKSSYEFVERNSSLNSREYAIVAEGGTTKIIKAIGSQSYDIDITRKANNTNSNKYKNLVPFFVQDSSGTKILLFNLSSDVNTIEIYRGEKKDKAPIFSGSPNANVFEVYDNLATIPGKIYKYTCVIYFSDGSFRDEKIKFQRKGSSKEINIRTKIDYKSGGVDRGDFSFRISNEITESGIEELINGISEVSPNLLTNDNLSSFRGNVKNLLWYSIERLDIESGEIWNFGFHQNKEFTDNREIRESLSIPELPRTGGCVYRVTPFLVSPVSILETLSTEVVNPENLQKEFVNFRKYYSSLANNWEVIPASERIARNPTVKEKYLLASSNERIVGAVASESFYASMPNIRENVQVNSFSFQKEQKRVNATFNDVKVQVELNKNIPQVIRITYSGNNSIRQPKIFSKLYFTNGRKNEVYIINPEVEISNITVELLS